MPIEFVLCEQLWTAQNWLGRQIKETRYLELEFPMAAAAAASVGSTDRSWLDVWN